MVQHPAEQKHAAADELAFVQGQGDADAAHEIWPRVADARDHRFAADRLDAVDLFANGGDIAVVVQRQQLQQHFAALADQGQVVQRQVGDQPPDQALAQGHTHRGGGLAQAADILDHRVGGNGEIAPFATERQQQRHVAVAAGKADTEGVAAGVDQF
ncbi:hypothetical protein D3C79_805460 [compost metagenome]